VSFLVQRAVGRGLTLTQVGGEVLRIGRGTNQELRSENPAVALEHAVIESDAAGYLITDKGSITGTYVNKKPVETARLAKGDVIEIGDLRIEVQIADTSKPLFLRVVTARVTAVFVEEEEEAAAAVVAQPGARVVKARKIDYVGAYRLTRPWMTKVSLTALLLIVALAVIGEIIPKRQTAFMPGGLSSAHARAHDLQGRNVAGNCDACHTPWKSVASTKCLDCHPQQPHADHEKNPPDCFSCHAEHRGEEKLADISERACESCHSDLTNHVSMPRAQLASLRLAEGRYSFEHIARIRDFGETHPELMYGKDGDTLRFNHRLHLAAKGVFSGTGQREVLQCTSCHALATVKGKTEPMAVDFEQHCQRCHRLTFDARFPNAEVPHGGDPGIVYGFVVATYSGDRELAGKAPAEVRRILTSRTRVTADDRAVLNAEQVIKTKCRQCHEVQRRGTRLAVVPPVIPASWLTRARFAHGRHRTIDCEKCHEGARQSVNTSDVLMPKRADCTACHAPNAKVAQAGSTCVTCHEYHQRLQRPVVAASLAQAGMGGLGGGGRMLQGILLAVIVVLLLVVLVPVGIALFRRLSPERGASAAAPPRRAAPPPRTPTPDKATDRIPRSPAPPPPDIAAPIAPVAPTADTSRMEPIRLDAPPRPQPPPPPAAAPVAPAVPIIDKTSVPSPSGTEMVQWNGMLHCTSGVLEGQRFIIEDEGLYIGRDPALAKIVIPDSRISKRHLRIVPRDGRVWAIDQGSTNGTFLKDQRITEVQLKRGDTLVLGDNAATFVYQI
jgi:pSer/pThr/pTyr-binding forkhead associated (FHA) protein